MIGPFYSVKEAGKLKNEKGWKMVEDSKKGYRRVVASPRPVRIVEEESVKRLLGYGEIVIAA